MALTGLETDMTAPLKAIDGNADLPALMTDLATRTRAAARVLALASPEQKNQALDAMERAIRSNASAILAANAEDAEKIKGRSSSDAAQILRVTGRAEMIHRDDLVIGPSGA